MRCACQARAVYPEYLHFRLVLFLAWSIGRRRVDLKSIESIGLAARLRLFSIFFHSSIFLFCLYRTNLGAARVSMNVKDVLRVKRVLASTFYSYRFSRFVIIAII